MCSPAVCGLVLGWNCLNSVSVGYFLLIYLFEEKEDKFNLLKKTANKKFCGYTDNDNDMICEDE